MNVECRMPNVEGMYSILFNKEMERHAAQAPALRERYHKSSVFNFQYSFPASPGWVNVRHEFGFWQY
jgi:hypothetical protein